jgi:hypothetical protein
LRSKYACVFLTFILLLCSKWLKYNLNVEFIWCYLFAREDTKTKCVICLNNNKFVTNTTLYLTLYTFSFEINESRLSDTRCMIQDVVSPHCGDKRMARRCTRRLCIRSSPLCDQYPYELVQATDKTWYTVLYHHTVCNKFI